MDHENGTLRVFSTAAADRAEQQTSESAVAPAAHDEHGRPFALIQEDLGRKALSNQQP